MERGRRMDGGISADLGRVLEENERNMMNIGKEKTFLSLIQVCAELSISVATGKNWIRTGKLIPGLEVEGNFFFVTEDILRMKRDIVSGKNSALKSRRNKKFVSGSQIYGSYISEGSKNSQVIWELLDRIHKDLIEVTDSLICAFIAECALQLMIAKEQKAIVSVPYLREYLSGRLDLGEFAFLIEDLMEGIETEGLFDVYGELFSCIYYFEDGEDTLGFLYSSLKNIGSRKAAGVYYTPTTVVKQLCTQLFLGNRQKTEDIGGSESVFGKSILDPCCGTGNFLLQLPLDFSIEQIFGSDIDEIGVKITRINMALKYGKPDKKMLYQHFVVKDYFNHEFDRKFDFIIGNPPWGYDFTEAEKKRWRKKYRSAVGKSIESYDIFVEQALYDLEQDGVLAFVLPEAILNVKTHMPIRRLLMENGSIEYLEFLGDVFDRVQCPCIILQIRKGKQPFSCVGMKVKEKSRSYILAVERTVSPESFCFFTTDEEYRILKKIASIPNKVTLKGNASFALGIVTGNNKKYLSNQKNNKNEMVLRGADIYKFCFHKADNYITFQPELFQQIAPISYYRVSEKLFYRFISNQLIFAYDNQQTLSLNSCNILIPDIPELNIKYIMAVLNSRVVQFYFEKQFRSIKVLRSHIEQIPIPLVGEEVQTGIVKTVEEIFWVNNRIAGFYNKLDNKCQMTGRADFCELEELYNGLDREIARLYGITDKEYEGIKNLSEGINLFLY